jgi:hypothetical protein
MSERRLAGRNLVRALSATLCALLLLVYIFAKIDFFTRYSNSNVGGYLREHSVYWAAMAALAFVIWLTERRLPRDS